MSKGTVRFPESAIVDGRIGTSRIAATIAGAAARLASTDLEPLRGAVQTLARGIAAQTRETPKQVVAAWDAVDYSQALSPLKRMQQLGRLGTGRMNKTEAAYEQVLAARLHAGEILWYRFEAYKLRLADNTFYTPDFPVITATNELMFIEVKGRWTDKARAKTKIAASQYPHRFIAIHRVGRHGWRSEDLTSRSW